jgi:hypothetical protein
LRNPLVFEWDIIYNKDKLSLIHEQMEDF